MRSQVPRLDVSYSFRAAAESRAFAQFPLLSVDEFGRHCKARNIGLGFGSGLYERLERLDRLGALCPVLFESGPRGGINDGVVPAQPTYRDEGHFVEWSQLSPPGSEDPADPEPSARARYSRWQLLYAWDAMDLGVVRVEPDWG